MESNVVLFPRAKKDTPPQSIDEVIENVVASRKEHIELFLEGILPLVFSNAADFNLDMSKEECEKPVAMFIESFRSALYSSCGLDHPLQDIAEDAFDFIDDEMIIIPKVTETEETVDINKE